MKILAKPFILIHKIVGYGIIAVLGTTFFLGVAGAFLGLLALIFASIGYAILWGILFFLCFLLGWALVNFVRIFDSEYAVKATMPTQEVSNTVTEVTGDLRKMAQEALK